MPVPNARHELMRRFTSCTRRLLRIKHEYGSPLSNVVDFGSSKAAMFRWLEHVAHGTLGTPNKHGEDPVTSNSSVKQRNRIDRGTGLSLLPFSRSSIFVAGLAFGLHDLAEPTGLTVTQAR
ncbi:hypothetical protein PIB30_003129 [Stylosanthes scabra]|uniref:Transposase n=1 Tax=Stylosanthes scabra TaxID=79078 RepID=A0ABU6Y3J5_9FABA|nr:hypothetical protein [Stylosanthes scabra]